jgi:hypothetical protein
MRWLTAFILCGLLLRSTAQAAEGWVYKVLPEFLDLNGRADLTPSLYDRDAYQNFLRKNPAKRSGLRFDVQWKAKGNPSGQLKLRVELRGVVQGDVPKQTTLELPVESGHRFSRWSSLTLAGDEYKAFGDVTAWHVTLWDGDKMLSEQKSFLW